MSTLDNACTLAKSPNNTFVSPDPSCEVINWPWFEKYKFLSNSEHTHSNQVKEILILVYRQGNKIQEGFDLEKVTQWLRYRVGFKLGLIAATMAHSQALRSHSLSDTTRSEKGTLCFSSVFLSCSLPSLCNGINMLVPKIVMQVANKQFQLGKDTVSCCGILL